MARRRYRDFRGGLIPSGPRESVPDNALRRARGIWPVRSPAIRSRNGTALIDTVPAAVHSFVRTSSPGGGNRFYGAGTGFYISSGGVVVLMPGAPVLNGHPLQFALMPPAPGQLDALYVAGGGKLFKVLKFSIPMPLAVRDWGIAPPPDVALFPAPIPQTIKVIDNCDASVAWVGPSPMIVDNTIKVEGTGSLTPTLTIPASSTATFVRAFFTPLNLNEFSPAANDSPDEDWIALALRIEHPRHVKSLEIACMKDSNNGFTSQIVIEDDVPHGKHYKKKRTGRKHRGLADHPTVQDNEGAFVASSSGLPIQLEVSSFLGEDRISSNDDAWIMLKIPKNAFTTVGTAVDWKNIALFQLKLVTNSQGSTTFWIDDIKLIGNVGMIGDYQYLFTYKSFSFNIRSNPNNIPIVVKGLQRQGVNFPSLGPIVSADPQVELIEIWRTLGNGSVFFLDNAVENLPLAYNDRVADFIGLHGSSPVLGTEVLPLDNVQPLQTFIDVVGPHYGRLFWLDVEVGPVSGVFKSSRVYYSPPGRPESVAGFVETQGTEEQGQRLIIWNDTVYLFTSKHLYLISGTTEPFIPVRVPGGRGTLWPRSVVATDFGIFFRAVDGPRVFDGSRTHRLGYEKFGQLYYGIAAENLLPLQDSPPGAIPATCACWTGEEWLLCDGVQTWAWCMEESQWVRDFGRGYTFLAYEQETGFTLVGYPDGRVGRLDAPDVFDDLGDPIPFDVMPAFLTYRTAEKALIQRLFIEANTGENVIVPHLTIDGVEEALPAIGTFVQQPVEWPIQKSGTVFGVRFTGSLVGKPVEIIAVEWDGPDVTGEQEAT